MWVRRHSADSSVSSGDLTVVKRAGRVVAVQASLALALVMLVVGGVVFAVYARAQNRQIDAELQTVATAADDANDPPPDMTSTLEIPTAADAPPESPVGSRRRFTRPTRHHVFLGVLLIATAVTYLWNITINGMMLPLSDSAAVLPPMATEVSVRTRPQRYSGRSAFPGQPGTKISRRLSPLFPARAALFAGRDACRWRDRRRSFPAFRPVYGTSALNSSRARYRRRP